MAVYSKNFYLKDFGKIGGKEVTAEIDKALDAALKGIGKKASDYHSEVKQKKAKAPAKEED